MCKISYKSLLEGYSKLSDLYDEDEITHDDFCGILKTLVLKLRN